MQERKHFCLTLTRLSGCGAGLGQISVACGKISALGLQRWMQANLGKNQIQNKKCFDKEMLEKWSEETRTSDLIFDEIARK